MEDKKVVMINILGGPGAGKSTTASAIFSILKLHDLNAELVTEYAKDLTWENRSIALQNQYLVWGKQYHRVIRVADKVDFIVTDSPLVLSIVYADLCGNTCKGFEEVVLNTYNQFVNFNFLLNRKKKYNPVGRNQKESEAIDIDYHIKTTLNRLNINLYEIDGTWNGINNIISIIFNNFDLGNPKIQIIEKKCLTK